MSKKKNAPKKKIYKVDSKKGGASYIFETSNPKRRIAQLHRAVESGCGAGKKFIDHYRKKGNNLSQSKVTQIGEVRGNNKGKKKAQLIQKYNSVKKGLNSRH